MARDGGTKSGTASTRGWSRLERMVGFLRESSRTAQAGNRLRLPANVSFGKYARGLGTRAGIDERHLNSQSRPGDKLDHARIAQAIEGFAARERALHASSRVTDRIEDNRVSRKLSPAMNALARVESSAELGRAMRAGSIAGQHGARQAVADGPRRDRVRERGALGRSSSIADARMASSIRAVTPPSSVAQREFAEPLARASGRGGNGAGITIKSSPTVVINAGAAGGNVQQDVMGALRAHRAELFDQLKRESARRERAQF